MKNRVNILFLAATLFSGAANAEPLWQEGVTDVPALKKSEHYSPGEGSEAVPATSNQDDPNQRYYPPEQPAYVKEAQEGAKPENTKTVQSPDSDVSAEGDAAATPPAEVVPPAPEAELPKWVETKEAKLKGLNKIFNRNTEIIAKKGNTAKFGALTIKVEKCFRMPESVKNESSALLLISETFKSQPSKQIFHGWMFSSSPAISALEHPLYDVILLECEDGKTEAKKDDKKEEPKAATKTDAKPAKAPLASKN